MKKKKRKIAHTPIVRRGKFGKPGKHTGHTGKWLLGREDELPLTIQNAVAQLQDPNCPHGWMEMVDVPHGQLYFVARTYAGKKFGTVVACHVVAEVEWGNWDK